MQVRISLHTDNHASTHHLVFTGRMLFLPPNQQRQSTEGIKALKAISQMQSNDQKSEQFPYHQDTMETTYTDK